MPFKFLGKLTVDTVQLAWNAERSRRTSVDRTVGSWEKYLLMVSCPGLSMNLTCLIRVDDRIWGATT